MQELKANPNRAAKGAVIEARLDKGRGPMATVLVQNGTLKAGDIIIAGTAVGRVRTMINDKGQRVNERRSLRACRDYPACPKSRVRATCSTPLPTSAWRESLPSSAESSR